MVRATLVALMLAGAASAAQAKTDKIQPATPGTQQIGPAPASKHPLVKKAKPKPAKKVDTPLRTDQVVLGENVGPGIAPNKPIEPRQVHTLPVIKAPPNWRGTQSEWEQHVRACYAQFGTSDWFTGEYIAAADLLAHCPYDRSAEGRPIVTARGAGGEHPREPHP